METNDTGELLVDIELTQDDFLAFNMQITRSAHWAPMRRAQQRYGWTMGLVFAFGMFVLMNSTLPDEGKAIAFVLVSGLVIFGYGGLQRANKAALELRADGGFLGSKRYRFNDSGVVSETENGRAHEHWESFYAIEQTEQHVFLYIDTLIAHILPLRHLDQRAVDALRAWFARHRPDLTWRMPDPDDDARPDSSHDTEGLEPEQPSLWQDILTDLTTGLRLSIPGLATARKSQSRKARPIPLALLLMGLVLVTEYLTVQEPSWFYVEALGNHAWRLLIVIAIVYLLWSLSHQIDAIRSLTRFLAALPLPVLVVALADTVFPAIAHSSAQAFYLKLFVLCWIAWIFYRALVWRASASFDKRNAISLAAALAVAGGWVLLPYSAAWYHYDAEDNRPAINVENVYYDQPDLLDGQTAGLAPQRPGVMDLYFVGFGSYAEQDVFKKEIAFARDLFERRFDTSRRSISLVNNSQTSASLPLANGHNLATALKTLGQILDPEEDVLFLYLTSHGSRDGKLSVSFWPLGLNDLAPADLQTMLDDAGIKWRVLVVSGCYSGKFLNTLQNDMSLVITAADSTSESFGCSNDRELTYFGEAYFKHALSQEYSFVRAFEMARDWINARESREGLKDSNPQMRLGSQISAKLDFLAGDLAAMAQ